MGAQGPNQTQYPQRSRPEGNSSGLVGHLVTTRCASALPFTNVDVGLLHDADLQPFRQHPSGHLCRRFQGGVPVSVPKVSISSCMPPPALATLESRVLSARIAAGQCATLRLGSRKPPTLKLQASSFTLQEGGIHRSRTRLLGARPLSRAIGSQGQNLVLFTRRESRPGTVVQLASQFADSAARNHSAHGYIHRLADARTSTR